MLEGLIREIKKLEQAQTIKVPIQADKDGFIDKECPSDKCLYKFKVNEEDWSNLFKDEAVFCPLCRHEAKADSWWTTEQIEEGKRLALEKVKSDVHSALVRGARHFNQQRQTGFITMSMKVSGSSPRFILMPMRAQEEMEQKIQCEKCNARFAVIGSGFFCPCCGHNSVERTFDDAIDKIRSNIENIPTIRRALVEAGQRDEAEVTVRHIIESSLGSSVTALQRFCEQVYRAKHPEKSIQMNAFQRIEFMDEAWKEVLGESLSTWLSEVEIREMTILYQRRHLLQHREGIVDEKYVQKSGDLNFRQGQRVVIRESDALLLAEITNKVATAIRKKSASKL